jgi:hypothetical protein
VLAVLSTLCAANAAGVDPETVFCLGTPDGSCTEFGLVDRTWPAFSEVYPKPVDFTIGRSPLTDWPYIHPSTHDSWAGGKPHTFTLRFHLDGAPTRPLHLFIGALAIFEPSLITITADSKEVGRMRPTTSTGAELAFQPEMPAATIPLGFELPVGTLAAGDNSLAITLDDGSWIIYDYVLLTYRATPPVIGAADPDMVRKMLDGPLKGIDEVVFAVRPPGRDGHWYANFGYYAPDPRQHTWSPGGKLCCLDLRSGKVTTLLEDAKGGVRNPQLDYDGKTILFSYRPGDDEHYHLYRCNLDGGGLTPLTSGPYDDIEPTWLPDGDIVFVSSRCNRWVNCWLTPVAVLYRCRPDGTDLRPISSNNEHDNTPWPLPDGRLLYTRWEYVDRSQVDYHHLWTTNPDGTAQMVYYGNLHPGTVMIDAKPIPGTDQIVSIFSPGHGATEHAGFVTIVDPKAGPDDTRSARRVSREGDCRAPWPVSGDCFLVAAGASLRLMNSHGQSAEIYHLTDGERKAGYWLNEPRPVQARGRETILPSRVDLGKPVGQLILADVNEGRNMAGIKPGEIKKLLVLESLPKPINYTGGMEPLSYGGTFTMERILGTVPVEADGSANIELPALRSVFFVALDEHNRAVKRMQSFVTVQPGEVTGCVGCHEQRTKAPPPFGRKLLATGRDPSRVEPIAGVPDVLDFPRDIQPILDRHCVACHNPDRREGGVNLSGDRGPMFSLSYFGLTARSQVADGRNLARSNYPPRALGSGASPLLAKLEPGHHGVTTSELEAKLVRLWTDVGGPYPGTYAALGSGMIGGYAANSLDRHDLNWPETKAGMEALQRRCASCHNGARALPLSVTDNLGRNPWEYMAPGDPRRKWASHLLYDLTRPEKSVLLLGPLAKAAGGYAACGQAVFADTNDADYQKVLAMVRRAGAELEQIKRFDMPGFQPPGPWLREMTHYGILAAGRPAGEAVDVYATERRYWESLWWKGRG